MLSGFDMAPFQCSVWSWLESSFLRVWVCLEFFSWIVSEKLLAQTGIKVINLSKLMWSWKPEMRGTAHSAQITAQQLHFVSPVSPEQNTEFFPGMWVGHQLSHTWWKGCGAMLGRMQASAAEGGHTWQIHTAQAGVTPGVACNISGLILQAPHGDFWLHHHPPPPPHRTLNLLPLLCLAISSLCWKVSAPLGQRRRKVGVMNVRR